MLNKQQNCGKLARNSLLRMDYMNRNSIVSLAMLYALWQANRKDLLGLITPFILFAVGNTTKVGDPIDIASICAYMESEFGYRSFQPAVITKVLSRHTSLLAQNARFIEKKMGHTFLENPCLMRLELSAKKGHCVRKRSTLLLRLLHHISMKNKHARKLTTPKLTQNDIYSPSLKLKEVRFFCL